MEIKRLNDNSESYDKELDGITRNLLDLIFPDFRAYD